ncbi:MAG: hypothetical protein WAT39_17035 [Planctomycetota bacterium]
MHAAELLHDLVANRTWERANAPYRLLRVHGPDAGEFLHRLCTQDVLGLGEGQGKPAAFLDAKGKLLATCLVFRLGGAFWLESHAEQVDRLAALLERYHFTEKLTIERPALAADHEWAELAANTTPGNRATPDRTPLVHFVRRGIAFTRSYQEGVTCLTMTEGRAVPQLPMTAETAECLRLLAGFLRVGVETEATTLALEADLDDHISTTKGCYTGQEIVARIHSYGHTNRKACLLYLGPGSPITAAQPLHEPEDKLAVGRVLHAVPIPGRDARLGVGYLPKDFQALGTKLVLADGAVVEVIGYEPLAGLPA